MVKEMDYDSHYWNDEKKGFEVIYKEGELISEKDFK